MKKKNPGRIGLLVSLTKGYRLLLLVSLIAMSLAILFNYLTPQIFRFTVDSVLGDEAPGIPQFLANWLSPEGSDITTSLICCAIAALVCSVLNGATNYVFRYTAAVSSESMIKKLRDNLFAHIQKLPYYWHVTHQTGDIIQRCTSDVEVVRGFVAGQIFEMLRTIVLAVLSLTLMFMMNVKLSLIAMAFIPIVTAYSGIFYSKISKRFQEADEAEGDLSATAQENFTGVRVVRAFGRESYEIDRFQKKNEHFADLWIKLGHVLSAYWGIGDLFSNLQVVTIIVVGALEAVAGNITLGEFMVFVSYNSMLVWPIRGLGRILSELSKTGVSIGRIKEILDAEEEDDSASNEKPDMTGDIVFENVSFDYYGVNEVLKGINMTIKAGSTVGILGATGSGKSTLMYLLERLYDLPDTCGRITIGGVDIRDIPRDHLRKNVGFVLQEPFLFSKTIQENIGIAHPGADLAEIRHSASIAAVDEAITDFSAGYDTIVGERGVTLSGGQKQRVAIARMLMQKAPVMIFDDSLSAVDAETDAKIRGALRENTGESTVILISHRITTLMHADCIFVIEDGRIVQQGTHDELCVQEGLYKQIYDIQGTLESELSGLTGGADNAAV